MPLKHYTMELCSRPPERSGLDGLLSEYYALMLERIEELGVDVGDGPESAIEEFWAEIDMFLPPNGRLYLARNESGELIGCGSLKAIGGGKGELKRLFVRPEARGTGLGKALVEARIEAAKEMGLKELVVDTIKTNVEMQGLYAKLGFSETDLYAESATHNLAPQLLPILRFYKLEL